MLHGVHVAGDHTDDAATTPVLALVGVVGEALDVAPVGDAYKHLQVGDKVVLAELGAGRLDDTGAARIAILLS